MKAAYVIGNITIVDNAIWLEYKSKVPATLIPWGGRNTFTWKYTKGSCW